MFQDELWPLLLEGSTRYAPEFARAALSRTSIDFARIPEGTTHEQVQLLLDRYYPRAGTGCATPCSAWRLDGLNLYHWGAFEILRRSTREPGPTSEQAARGIASELDGFLGADSVMVEFVGELRGLVLGADCPDPAQIDTSYNLRISNVTEEMIDKFSLGLDTPGRMSRVVGTCAVRAEAKYLITWGSMQPVGDDPTSEVVQCVQRLLIALQVAKAAPVGIPLLVSRVSAFPPVIGLERGWYFETPRIGIEVLRSVELPLYLSLYQGLRDSPNPSILLACSRLGQSRLRLDSSDAILDAAIGLEAILLFDPTNREKQELRYRFALHYALLATKVDQREGRFKIAQAFYDTRSAIAHGGHPEEKVLRRLHPSGSLYAGAEKGQSMLQECVLTFADDMHHPRYSQPGFWRSCVLGSRGECVEPKSS